MDDRRPRLLSIVLLSAIALGGGAAPPAKESQPGIQALAWMAGAWFGEQEGTTIEEQWLEPAGGLMLGMHRDIFPSGKTFFEFLRIEVGEKGPVYLASPRGEAATPFVLVESGPRRAVFSNPQHDYPQRILYWIEGDAMHARIEGQTSEGPRSSEWVYRRR